MKLYLICDTNFENLFTNSLFTSMNFTLRRLFFNLFLLASFSALAQEFTPIVTQFTGKDYNASNQNWSVGQDKSGIMYFGNNQGLLQFDGSMWETYKMPENKLVRSLMTNDSNRIYVGSFEEFGFFEKTDCGRLKYTSLSAKLKNYKMQNDEIWNILDFNGTIIFQSFTSYFTYKNGRVEGVHCPYTFLFFSVFNNSIFAHTDQYGFSRFDYKNKLFVPVQNSIIKSPVISVLKTNQNNGLLVTQSDGLFKFDGKSVTRFITEVDDELKKAELNRALITSNGQIILGSILNGVIAINSLGQKLWMLNTSNVLQNNTVLGMTCDRENNLWLALDKGIAVLQLNSSLRYIHSFNPSIGAIYTLGYRTPDLFIGTNQGLYKSNLNKDKRVIQKLQLVPNIKGQVWSISNFDNQLICGNNEETFDVSSSKVSVISLVKGGICIKRGLIHGRDVLVQGTYTQLCIYVKKNDKWTFSHTIENFINPIRYLEIDYTGTIWASHLHQGLYAIQLSTDLKKNDRISTFKTLDQKHEYPINVFSINNRVVFTDNTGFYTYDDIQKKIIPYHELNNGLGYFAHSYRVCPFKGDLYWFIRNGEAALYEIKPPVFRQIDVVQYSRFLNETVDDYQNIVPVSDKECLFTLENGLSLYRLNENSNLEKNIKLQFKSIQTANAESKQIKFLSLKDNQPHITPFTHNNLIFRVFYPHFSNLSNMNYRFKLVGLDKVWSEATSSPRKEYNYLPNGEYKLQVLVLSKTGRKLSEVSYDFEVLPPFYLTLLAKIIYILLLILIAYIVYLYIQRSFHVKKEKIRAEEEEIRKREIEKREKQIIALEKEKLESELTVKSKELAESTMTIIKKNEILVNIKQEVINQKDILGSQYPNKYYDKLIRLLDENLSSEDDWTIFQTNFDRIHENFFRNLHTNYPDLTSNDLRFCAYLRLNLSSKDIAHLMNISLKGVEVGRYRIRKKIGLESTKSLTEFMIEFK